MYRILSVSIFTTLLSLGSVEAMAVDLSGRVQTSDGTPLCALVLASGRSMFSCNPSGPFNLTGLPTESDGTIKLQVYVDGFLPYSTRLTNFGFQTVVMTRSGSCPVDDGLSDRSPLDGTYTLLRATVVYNDSTAVDSVQSNIQVTGTMTISNGIMEQRNTLTINGVPQPPIYIRSRYVDHGYYIDTFNPTTQAFEAQISLTERGKKLILFTNANSFGGGFPYAEVDQWAKVTSNVVTSLESEVSLQSYTPSAAPMGGLFGAMAEGQGLKITPEN